MSEKRLLFHAAAREKVLEGATALADAVRITLGPKSKCVLIGRRWGTPLVCDDGVTIAKELELADPDERTGYHILRKALEAPTRQIAENSEVDGGVVVERMRAGGDGVGFDAATGRYVDLIATGIVDPTKVLRLALENAVSAAAVLLLTEATLVDIPEPKPPAERPSPDLGGG